MTQHEAGRELDALIATQVMGRNPDAFRYRCSERHDDSPMFASFGEGDFTLAVAEAKCALYNEHGRGFRPEIANIPDYSTDIAAAWLVVEKMRAESFDFDMRLVATWTACFSLDMGLLTFSADAETAPLAICRAALLACPSATPSERGEA